MEHVTVKEIAAALNISTRAVHKKAKVGDWLFDKGKKSRGGGYQCLFPVSSLPSEVQVALAQHLGWSPDTPGLRPEAALSLMHPAPTNLAPTTSHQNPDTHGGSGVPGALRSPAPSPDLDHWKGDGPKMSPAVLEDDRVMRIMRIMAEAGAVPPGWRRRAWVESVAERHGTTFQTIYKWIKKYDQVGLAGLKHTHAAKGQAAKWDPEALDWWIGLCLKRAHRKISRKWLYWNVLIVEANRRGWRIGGERSAQEWASKRITPQLRALQKGGTRGLDNMMPPVRRNYSDLRPFQIIVGDQHRFDFWVQCEETGEVFRPEGYFWQDLRTRLWYGGAVDRRYDGHLMGVALHVGCRAFGAFETVYTDNGKPEQSKYIMNIVRDINRLGMEAARSDDEIPAQLAGMEDEEDMPLVRVGQRFAIPKNAKAKMIEGSFSTLEQVLRDVIRLPGNVKTLGGNPEENDIDQAEIQRLAQAGKLPTFEEFRLAVYRAMDFYNQGRPHRGARKEWCFGAKPREVRPAEVLRACFRDGWRPRTISREALDLIFLARAKRVVRKGQIEFAGDYWEAFEEQMPDLMALEGRAVQVRYDPMAMCELIVFDRSGEFVCIAQPAAMSSMIDLDRASALIARKRRRRRAIQDQYHLLTAGIPDTREFSRVPREEKAAAAVGRGRTEHKKRQEELYRERTPEELAAEVADLEVIQEAPARKKDLPERPGYFLSEFDRYAWCVKYEAAGGEMDEADRAFMAGYEADMTAEDKEMWAARRTYG